MHAMTLGENIKRLRGSRRQLDIATAAGVPQGTISQLESGYIVRPRLDTLEALARGLGVSLAELVDPDNAKRSKR